jgi:hypothetical protein
MTCALAHAASEFSPPQTRLTLADQCTTSLVQLNGECASAWLLETLELKIEGTVTTMPR